ncbi:hypothetical protein TNCV_1075841 [Trichonephila clavipes]|uniref:Uncharacterized protein n=1 Tax=Trichonephila clavipes TaxID=2585209 RepID=A0A8X6SQ28_TRICX|nr:hypothetical protein TNCV_1075841 [Trichonephila clavipes]
MNAAERINDDASTFAAGAVEIMQADNEIASILRPDFCTSSIAATAIHADTSAAPMGIIGHDINVTMDGDAMVQQLQRQLADQALNVNITKSMVHKCTHLRGVFKRPTELESICLADFVAWYTFVGNRKRKRQKDDENEEFSEDDDNDKEDPNAHSITCGKRDRCRVIRNRSYETDDIVNHKREMVMLYIPFRCEAVDILDRNVIMETYYDREAEIMEKRNQYELIIDIQRVVENC